MRLFGNKLMRNVSLEGLIPYLVVSIFEGISITRSGRGSTLDLCTIPDVKIHDKHEQ